MSKIKYDSTLFTDNLKIINECVTKLNNSIYYLGKTYGAESYYVNISNCKAKVNVSKTKFNDLSKWVTNTNTKIDTISKNFKINTDNIVKPEVVSRKNIVNS